MTRVFVAAALVLAFAACGSDDDLQANQVIANGTAAQNASFNIAGQGTVSGLTVRDAGSDVSLWIDNTQGSAWDVHATDAGVLQVDALVHAPGDGFHTGMTLIPTGGDAGTMNLLLNGYVFAFDVGFPSSRALKTDIHRFSAELEQMLGKLAATDVVSFRDKREPTRTRYGVIAEDSPKEILGADGRGVSLPDFSGALLERSRRSRSRSPINSGRSSSSARSCASSAAVSTR